MKNEQKEKDFSKPQYVDVLIQKVPFHVYQDIRKEYMNKGHHVQGYEPNYYEGSNKLPDSTNQPVHQSDNKAISMNEAILLIKALPIGQAIQQIKAKITGQPDTVQIAGDLWVVLSDSTINL